MISNMMMAAEIAAEIAEMFPVEPGTSTPDRMVAEKLAELIQLLTEDMHQFERHLEQKWSEQWDARHDAHSAHWGWD